jgi:hypothetical protein
MASPTKRNEPDQNADTLPSGAHGYVVHSTYFDTPDLFDYTARLSQHRVRRRAHGEDASRGSSRMVTGPSLTDSTSIIVRNIPC